MSVAVIEKTSTNDLGYAEMEADSFKPLGDRILVQWEPAQNEMKVGKATLIRPETHKKIHYTGIVISVGPLADPDLKAGQRIIFDQFSNFEKYFDPKYGRLALIEESNQGSCFAIIPARTIIGGAEGDFFYDR